MKTKFCGLEKISLVDYEGKIACTLFTKGCNFKCPFCHNSTLVYGNDPEINFIEILAYLEKRKNFLEVVCISGGEPTLGEDLEQYLIPIKQLGYLIKLDTNGTNPDLMQDLVNKKLIDYVAMDIKNSPTNYNKTTGLRNLDLTNIQKSIDYLKTNTIDYEFRTTLVDEFHTESDIEAIGQWLSGSKRYFLQKFVDHDTCIQENLHEVPKEKALKYKRLLQKYLNNIELRGY